MRKKELEINYLMDDRHNHNHQPNNGFLMGAIVGAVATLLFTTKKGREIVRELSDKGLERLSEWESSIQEQEIIREEENDYIEPVEVEKLKLVKDSVFRSESSKPALKSESVIPSKPHVKSSTTQKGKMALPRYFKSSKKN